MVRHWGRGSGGEPPRGERGETLLELMATVLIMALGVVAVLSMIFTAIKISQSYRKTTTANTEVQNFAEDLLQTGTGQLYEECADPSDYAYSSPVPGYTAEVVEIEYLADRSSPTLAWQDTCPSEDQGLQLLHVRVTSEEPEEQELLKIIKRDRTCADGTGERC